MKVSLQSVWKCIATITILMGCALGLSGRVSAQNADYITTVGNGGNTFVQAGTSTTFTPIGYGEFWCANAKANPSTWFTTLTNDFTYCKSIGANTMRIWAETQYMLDPPSSGHPYGTPDAAYLADLVSIINMANSMDMRVDIGVNDFGYDPKPSWFTGMTQAEQWDAWQVEDEAVAQAASGATGSNAILDYQLASEQAIGSLAGPGTLSSSGTTVTGTGTTFTTTFQVGSTFTVSGTTYTVHTITNNTSMTITTTPSTAFSGSSYTLTLATYIADYMIQMDAGIRAYDTTHLIQAGLVQSSNPSIPPADWPETPAMYAPYVNFLAIHDYPGSFVIPGDTNVQSAIAQLDAFSGLGPAYGMPVLVEETCIIWCSDTDEGQFLAQASIPNGGDAGGILSSAGTTPISDILGEMEQGAITISNASNTTPIEITTATPMSYGDGSYDISGVVGNTAANNPGLTVTNASDPSPISITNASNTTPITITTSTNHGYWNGETVTVQNVQGNTAANGTWEVENVTTNTFQVVNGAGNSVGNGTYVSSTGTTTPPILVTVSGASTNLTTGASVSISGVSGNTFTITNASNASPIQITTSANNGYTNGQKVIVSGVGGNTAANGTWTITVVNQTHFTLNGSTGNASYTSGGSTTPVMAANGSWTITAVPSPYIMCFTLNGSAGNGVAYVSGGTATWDWGITPIDSTHFTLNNSIGNGTYTSGGTASLSYGSFFVDDFQMETLECMISPQDLSFEAVPILTAAPNNISYGGTGSAWNYSAQSGSNSAGVCGNGSSLGNPNAPQGTQAAFIQGTGIVTQKFYLVHGTNYTISFDAAQQSSSNSQSVWLWDYPNYVFGTWTFSGTSYSTYSCNFTYAGTTGWQSLSFNGQSSTGAMCFIDNVSVSP